MMNYKYEPLYNCVHVAWHISVKNVIIVQAGCKTSDGLIFQLTCQVNLMYCDKWARALILGGVHN